MSSRIRSFCCHLRTIPRHRNLSTRSVINIQGRIPAGFRIPRGELRRLYLRHRTAPLQERKHAESTDVEVKKHLNL
ncbi:hypothetical protein L596_000807 [Steinernema carpocapsae]|uniref:Uncharacterized protein n=1 Tax=Steinernema carpocapsae TaxID=34508 RepID=A0A4V6I6Z0_STECR|nr:hypothetical protein L596_000807 [Steinernema carpocapsae]